MIKDFLGRALRVGDVVAISTTNGIRVGRINKINTHESSYGEVTFTVQIQRQLGDGTTKRQTLDYRTDNYYRVQRVKVRTITDNNEATDKGVRITAE